MDPKHIESKS